MARKKLRIGVLFGGRSAEHEVSIVSARSVMSALDKKKYEVIPIGISKAGEWLVGGQVEKLLASGARIPPALRVTLPSEPQGQALIPLARHTAYGIRDTKLDVIFPVLHGTYGEDGTVQGLLELTGLPYVGAGVLGSSVGMDKVAQKLIFNATGIPTPKFVYTSAQDYRAHPASWLAIVCHKIGFPCFVKPPNLGSSIGISQVHSRNELPLAITLALRYDRKVIVEEGITRAWEIECAVLGNDRPQASVAGRIISSNEFYDYNAKYVDGKSQAVIPAPLPRRVVRRVQALAVQAFTALDLAGMARVDFLVQPKGWRVYLNEVNTIPGFTSISMYPKLWAASGLAYPKLLDKLIALALARGRERAQLNTSFKPKSAWYR